MRPYTLVILSDTHYGDVYGLVNPAEVRTEYKGFARILFKWYVAQIKDIGKVDHILHLGETTEGPGKKSTLELFETDMHAQGCGAAELLMMWDCPKYSLCYASKYHSGNEAKTERTVVDRLIMGGRQADIRGIQKLLIRGVRINAKHKVGGSSVPYGDPSQAAKTATNDIVRAWGRGYEPADWYFRGHIHKYWHVENDSFHVVINPAMKWPLGEYGYQLDIPYYSMGLSVLRIWNRDRVDFERRQLKVKLPEEAYVTVE